VTPLDFIRSGVAFLVLASHLPSLFLWVAIHPFSAFWRKRGPIFTFGVLGVPVALYVGGAWFFRRILLGADWGANAVTMALAGFCVVGALLLRGAREKHPDYPKLSGVPELSRDKFPGQLLTDGIYGRVRNPRYLESLLWVLGYSFFANYSGSYLVWLAGLPVMYWVVVLEERELRHRFGPVYEEYSRRVPRFIPKFGKRKKAE